MCAPLNLSFELVEQLFIIELLKFSFAIIAVAAITVNRGWQRKKKCQVWLEKKNNNDTNEYSTKFQKLCENPKYWSNYTSFKLSARRNGENFNVMILFTLLYIILITMEIMTKTVDNIVTHKHTHTKINCVYPFSPR